MKRYLYIGFYLIFSGIGISVLQVKALLTEEELQIGTGETVHLVSEFIMTALCIFSGIFLVAAMSGGRRLSLFALGMLLYSLINKSGYYWETNQMKWLIVFVLLIFCSLISFIILLRDKRFSTTGN